MKEVPIHNWNSKRSLCSDLRFYQAHGDACVVCGYMPSLQLGWGVWKVEPAISKCANTDSIFGWTERNWKCKVKVFTTLPPSAVLWGKCQLGRRERRVRRAKPAPSRGPSRLQGTSAVTSRHITHWRQAACINNRDRPLKPFKKCILETQTGLH